MPRRGSPLPAVTLLAMTVLMGCGPEMEDRSPEPEARPEETEILWDSYGVPHIYARTDEALYYAFGWAQMRNHADLILRLYGIARGRGAEYWGEEHLPLDRWVRTMGIPARAEAWYAEQGPRQRAFLDAFARGMNDYADRHPERIDDRVRVVLPVTGRDALAHTQRSIHFTFIAGPGLMLDYGPRWAKSHSIAAAAPSEPTPGPPAASNAWALGASRSESGHGMLLANPHLPWSDLFTWFESQLVSPSADAYGATLVGVPWLGIAFNDHLGWTHTVNTHDGFDLYELSLSDGGYLYDGAVEPFDERVETITVRRPDGSLREEPLEIRESVHGPVIAKSETRALALRLVGLDQPHLAEQYWAMIRATSLEEFERAVSRLQMPTFTVMYADRDGHILHLFGGRTPVRPEGDWNWSGIVPGDVSETLWTETHAYDELPRVVDPPAGWLQNANDPPWTTTFPRALEPNDYPPYMAPRRMGFRPQRSARMLHEDERITYEELLAYKHSTRMETADRYLDELLPAARAAGSRMAERAAGVLDAWDRSADADSRGAVLFEVFMREVRDREWPGGFSSRAWNPEAPLETPDGLRDPSGAVAALAAAARTVEDRFGSLDVAWGEVYRLRAGGLDLPSNGGPGSLGIFRVVGYREDDDGRFRAASGDSYVAAIEFSTPVRARVLLGYGNASQPDSPHRTDQYQLFQRKVLRPAWRSREEIESNLELHEPLPWASSAADGSDGG